MGTKRLALEEIALGKVHDFLKCEKCGKELSGMIDQRALVDREGFTRIYCPECFKTVEKI